MTTDPFTEAARAEAGTLYAVDWDTPAYYGGEDQREAEQFLAGAEWARDHLARQEVTDAGCIHVLNVLGTDLGQPTRTDFEWSQSAIRRCREALTAAKEARA